MSKLRGIDAEYVNWRTVIGRKVLQLVFEIDISRQQEVLTMLGVPTVGESKWVAIAPLDLTPKSLVQAKPEASGSPKKFHELPLSQQAAIRCGDPLFQEYMGAENEAQCTAKVRGVCDVMSRSEIVPNMRAGSLWQQTEAQYQSWLTDRKFAEAKR